MVKDNFNEGDYVVYPAHGVGKLVGMENQEIAGHSVKLLVISFEKDRMVLRLPASKAQDSGLRPISNKTVMTEAVKTLQTKTKAKRTMWSRRAQEYETKINSGDLVALAEVIRDLHRSSDQPDQSYSERQLYQGAMERFIREFAAVENIDEHDAIAKLEGILEVA